MIEYLKGEPKNIDGVMDLLSKIRKQFKEEGLDIYQDDEYPTKEILLNDLKNNEGTLVALNDDKVVGYIAFSNENDFFDDCFGGYPEDYLKKYSLDIYKGKFIGLARLMVDPNYQNKGIGTNIFKKLEQYFINYVIIFLVDKNNLNAQKLYKKLGYNCLSLENFSFGEYYVYIKRNFD